MFLLATADHHKHRVVERKLYGVESSSTFLECIPKSLQARVTWTFQKNLQQAREEVRGGKLYVVLKLLLLYLFNIFPSVSLGASG